MWRGTSLEYDPEILPNKRHQYELSETLSQSYVLKLWFQKNVGVALVDGPAFPEFLLLCQLSSSGDPRIAHDELPLSLSLFMSEVCVEFQVGGKKPWKAKGENVQNHSNIFSHTLPL